MNRDELVLGALHKLGIPYDNTNYETDIAYQTTLKEFNHCIEDALQSVGSEYVSKVEKLNRAVGSVKEHEGVNYYPYELPNGFLVLNQKPQGNFFFTNRYFYSDQEEISINYSTVVNYQDLNFKFRKYIEYYLASEVADILNRSSLKENLRQRANLELQKINSTRKIANKDYFSGFTGGVDLY